MSNLNSKDQLFYQIVCDLADDIVSDTQAAAELTIDLSSQFLGEDSESLIDEFRILCRNDEAVKISEMVDVDTNNKNSADNEIKTATYEMQLGVVKKNMELVSKKDAAIRAEVNVVLSSMQFSEFLRQHLAGLTLSYEVLINSKGKSTEEIKKAMQETMHTYDERKAYHECVMHESMPEEDEEITQDLIDQMIG